MTVRYTNLQITVVCLSVCLSVTATGTVPKKVVLTFAPCGRSKTMTFAKWLGIDVPPEVESRLRA